MPKPKVCMLRAAGTNCDVETAFAFFKAGAHPEFVHINELISLKKYLKEYQILAISGGFTYADDLGAGKILANELKFKLIDDVKRFIQEGKLIIGICNGFQVLVKSGLLPGNNALAREVSLTINDSGKFEDRWVYLRISQNKCIWTRKLPDIIYLPVAHGEGKFVAKDKSVLRTLKENGQIVFQYCNQQAALAGYPDNPNGSEDNIAGICDTTGRILGLMPHPERHMDFLQHPRRFAKTVKDKEGDGLGIFRNAIEYVKEG